MNTGEDLLTETPEKPTETPIVSITGQTIGVKRTAPTTNEENVRKRICGPTPDLTEKLEEEMAYLGDNKSKNIVEVLKNLSELLINNLDEQQDNILNVFERVIKWKPEKLTIYSTLAGLVNAAKHDFGEALLQRAVSELEKALKNEEYHIALRITTFIADLGNTKVASISSIFNFLNRFVVFTQNENLQTDYFVFMVLHTLPWIGLKLSSNEAELSELWEKLTQYISKRTKLHMKALQVWTGELEQNQDDYIDSLWAQICDLRIKNWDEQHILRVDMAFVKELTDSETHDISDIVIPEYSETANYPLPFIVFRLFQSSDVFDTDNPLPSTHSIERFLVEEDLNWIISNNYLNTRQCAKELLQYFRADSIPLPYCIIEVIFSQMFRLPESPYIQIFYGTLLIELCRASAETIPQVLAFAANIIYDRIPNMQLVCIERFINWFSYHLSNFQYRWSWNDWENCLDTTDEFNLQRIVVREVIEKCMRFSYHKKIIEVLPTKFHEFVPNEPKFIFVVDDPDHPEHEKSLLFSNQIKNRISIDDILSSLKIPENELNEEIECIFNPDLVAIFFGTLLKLASQTFSHTFAAINKYHKLLLEFVKYPDIMQPVLLRTIHECWGNHKQFLILLVDKLLKIQVFDPYIISAWVFCGDLKDEINRSWVWEILNIAITRASKQYHANKEAKESVEKIYEKKKLSYEQKQLSSSTSFTQQQDDDIFPNKDDIDVDEDDLTNEPLNEIHAKLASLEENLRTATEAYDKSYDELKNIVLDVCHKFAVEITEYLSQSGSNPSRSMYTYLIGRFREILILHWKEIFLFWDDVKAKLLDSPAIEDEIRELFIQFRALKY